MVARCLSPCDMGRKVMADMGRKWLEKRGIKLPSGIGQESGEEVSSQQVQGPLKGVKILDLTRYQNGPSATRRLADYGADVIKVENPAGGDQGRGLIFTPDRFDVFFEAFNRGKRSICVDLRNKKARPVMKRLIEWADVLAENFRPGVLESWGYGYKQIKSVNPSLIYASNSGWGPRGPLAGEGAFDLITQAYSGAMVAQGGGPSYAPVPAEWALADEVGAMNFAFAIVSALVARDRQQRSSGEELPSSISSSSSSCGDGSASNRRSSGSQSGVDRGAGSGQLIETSQLGAMISFQAGGWNNIARVLHDGKMRDDGKPAYTRTPMQGAYCCADGRWLVLNPANWSQWEAACRTFGREDLLSDSRGITSFTPPGQRERNKPWLRAQLSEHLLKDKSISRDAWVDALRRAGVFCGPVLDYGELMEQPHVWENCYLTQVEHPRLGRKTTFGNPIVFHSTPATVPAGAPELGEHTEKVLMADLGFTKQEVDAFSEQGVTAKVKKQKARL